MRKQLRAKALALVLCLLLGLALPACDGSGGGDDDRFGGGDNGGGKNGGSSQSVDPDYERTSPTVQMPVHEGTNQVDGTSRDGTTTGFVDMTNVNKGYVAAACTSPGQPKFRVYKGDGASMDYEDYYLDGDGTVNYFPIPRGDGQYTFVIFQFLRDTDQGPEYTRLIETSASVALESEFAPFLVPNKLVDYTPESECIKLSFEITRHCVTNLDVTREIYAWIAANIAYDVEKAEAIGGKPVQYDPYPDETLSTKKGICYDYSSLAAAMLRANGVPTKLVKGEVLNTDGSYIAHAWNMVYLEEEGWIAVELPAKGKDWTRIDTTAAAGNAYNIGQFIGDGKNYTEFTVH